MVISNYCLYVKSLTKHCFNIFFEALTAIAVEQVFAGDCQISFFVDTPSTSKDPWPESESEFHKNIIPKTQCGMLYTFSALEVRFWK